MNTTLIKKTYLLIFLLAPVHSMCWVPPGDGEYAAQHELLGKRMKMYEYE